MRGKKFSCLQIEHFYPPLSSFFSLNCAIHLKTEEMIGRKRIHRIKKKTKKFQDVFNNLEVREGKWEKSRKKGKDN